MTPAEFRVVREFLGLTGEWVGAHLAVADGTVRDWENGARPVPDSVRTQLMDLERLTGEFVRKAVDALLGSAEPGIVTFRDDTEYHAAHPESGYPASWHRAVCARVALEVPGLTIAYADAVESVDVKVEAE
ncbi:helix-turn-helix domain-containing protein [Streptomyces sp. NPDC088785]|uniref:helix-turn-helix domain-containing protein n=1 Tax=Streptomyces sp. NPDC088785 TaxID=3365897 RepID=UPI0038029360